MSLKKLKLKLIKCSLFSSNQLSFQRCLRIYSSIKTILHRTIVNQFRGMQTDCRPNQLNRTWALIRNALSQSESFPWFAFLTAAHVFSLRHCFGRVSTGRVILCPSWALYHSTKHLTHAGNKWLIDSFPYFRFPNFRFPFFPFPFLPRFPIFRFPYFRVPNFRFPFSVSFFPFPNFPFPKLPVSLFTVSHFTSFPIFRFPFFRFRFYRFRFFRFPYFIYSKHGPD